MGASKDLLIYEIYVINAVSNKKQNMNRFPQAFLLWEAVTGLWHWRAWKYLGKEGGWKGGILGRGRWGNFVKHAYVNHPNNKLDEHAK